MPAARSRSDANMPVTIPGLKLWLDARRPGTTFADGDPVASWKDLSGLGNDVVQPTAAKKPLYRSQGRNLLTYNQSTVETDASDFGLVLNAASVTRVTSTALHGVASAAAASFAAGDMSVRDGIIAGITPGAQYTSVASVKSAVSARTCTIGIRWYDSGSTFLSGSTGTSFADNTSTWVQGSCTATAPANAVKAAVWVMVAGAGGANEIHYMDCLGLWAGTSTTWVPPVTTPNGQPVVQFDGVDDFLSNAINIAQPATVYVVGALNNITGVQSFVGGGGTLALQSSGTVYRSYSGTSLLSGTSITTAVRTLSGVFNGASSVVSVDGTATTGDAGSSGSTGWNVGTSTGSSVYLQGAVASVLVYSGAHDANTRKRIGRWLGRQYGVAITQ